MKILFLQPNFDSCVVHSPLRLGCLDSYLRSMIINPLFIMIHRLVRGYKR